MKDDKLIAALRKTFGAGKFTVHEILAYVPQLELPAQVRMALMGGDVLGTSGTRSLGMLLRSLDGVEAVGRSKRGRVWRLNPDAVGERLGRPVGTPVGRIGQCRHCLKESGNLDQHERRCAAREVPAAPAPNTYVEEINREDA